MRLGGGKRSGAARPDLREAGSGKHGGTGDAEAGGEPLTPEAGPLPTSRRLAAGGGGRFPLPRAVQAPAASLVILAIALYLGFRPLGPLPPLGPFLDPVNGVWAVAGAAELPKDATERIAGLDSTVDVVYDDRAVPHIFAASELDAYRALGYVVARDRLFQLELQSRAGAGTLSELVGPRALVLDRETRALGLPRAAERKLAALDTASDGYRVLQAYAEGVNAYLRSMSPRDLPIEYRLLGTRPMRWRPIDSIHLLNRMGWTLSYLPDEFRHERLRALVGDAAADALLPIDSPIQEPIQPVPGRMEPRDRFAPLPPPGPPDARALREARMLEEAIGPLADVMHRPDGDVFGSNNWAVAPSRTKDGFALLAGDPHLELTLPSIWYEVHLVVPGQLDAYGVTIPGAPAIILGFNRDVAWSFTNTGADVLDFYRETVDDVTHPTRYRVDGGWRELEQRIERYRDPAGALLRTDTILYTHRGPMRRTGGRWLSMRWTVLDPSPEVDAFVRAARATSAEGWLAAMADYVAPAQNMAVADRSGTIAIRSTGRFPIRPGDGRGDLIHDGSTSAHDWAGSWSVSRYPAAIDPAQGYLASANQQPLDPAVDSAYLGAAWPSPWRALRINQLLRADTAVTPDDMRRFQTDPGSARADRFVPLFLAAARRTLAASPSSDTTLRRAAELLAQWDRRYTRDNERAILFELAMRALADRTWDELVPRGADARLVTPSEAVLAELLAYPTNVWWDDRRTPRAERRDDILAASLREALVHTERVYGDPGAGGWRWSRIRHANIYHLLGLPSFSALDLPVQGGPGTLSPSQGRGTDGPSWRMVVELGPRVRAWSIYPGGQSGNPVSSRYLDRLPRWLAGELDAVRLPPRRTALAPDQVSATLTLTPVP